MPFNLGMAKTIHLDSESDEEGNNDIVPAPGPQITAATEFEVDPDIDVDSEGLKDLISSDPMVCEGPLRHSAAMDKPPIVNTALDWSW